MENAKISMAIFRLFLAFLCFSVLLTQCRAKISKMEWRKLDNIHNMIQEELKEIKTKVWVEVATEIGDLKARLDVALQNGNMTEQIMPMIDDEILVEVENLKQQLEEEKKLKLNLENELWSCLSRNSDRLYTAFKEEKRNSRELETKLQELNLVLGDFKEQTAEEIKSLQKQFSIQDQQYNETVTSIENLEQEFDNVLTSQDSMTEEMEQIKEDAKRKSLNNFEEPGFVSPWMLMKAQDNKLSQITIAHGLGSYPYKVDVQTRSTLGDAWWIFPGGSAFQSDDDTTKPYGGVVYFYNQTHVTLFAPKNNNNNHFQGKIILTGDSKYKGHNPESADAAYVRVKAWGPENMSPPDFQSDWLQIDITDKRYTFYDIKHHLGDYPAIVTVNVRCVAGNLFMVSDGVGATVKHYNLNSAFGGVVWGFNNESVRLWSLHADGNDREYLYQTLFGDKDGWGLKGKTFDKNLFDDIKQGHVMVRAWSKDQFEPGKNFIQHKETPASLQHHGSVGKVSLEKDLFFLSVQAEDGVNKGYRFSGSGSAQAQGPLYGGVVYSYSQDGGVRAWSPDPGQGGYTVHIHSPFGNDVNVQATNNVSYVLTWIKS